MAGGCAPGQDCYEDAALKKTRPAGVTSEVISPVDADPEEVPEAASEASSDDSGLNLAIAAGVNVLYFDCEDAAVAPGIFVDYQPDEDLPINIRFGVEGTQVDDAEQFQFRVNTALSQTSPDFDFIRIPLSIEHVTELGDHTNLFIGGGPDLIIVDGDNNIDDTIVGLHLGARVQQDITEDFAVSLGAGYLFAEADAGDDDEEFDLDGAYTGVHFVANLF